MSCLFLAKKMEQVAKVIPLHFYNIYLSIEVLSPFNKGVMKICTFPTPSTSHPPPEPPKMLPSTPIRGTKQATHVTMCHLDGDFRITGCAWYCGDWTFVSMILDVFFCIFMVDVYLKIPIYIYVYISNTVHINIINICITYNHIGWIIGCISVPASWRIHIKQKRGTSSKLKDCYWDRDTAKPTTKSNQIPKLLVVEQRIHGYSLPEKIPSQKERIVVQPSFFRGKLLVSGRVTTPMYQWLFLVPLKGGRDYITPQKARTISGI